MLYVTPKEDMVRAVEEQLRRRLHLVFGDAGELRAKGVDIIS